MQTKHTESAAAIARHQAALEAAARQLDALALGSAPSGARGVGVRYWSDYLKVQLHPRSFQALQGAWHGARAAGLEGYGAASSLTYGVRPAVEAVADAVRWWSEGCDSLQGAGQKGGQARGLVVSRGCAPMDRAANR